MNIFETERLLIKRLESKDEDDFIELLSDPKIIIPIPQPTFTKHEIVEKFSENMNFRASVLEKEKYVCAIFEKGNPEMIGLCLFLTNEENDHELGYRFKVNYWGKGYGTETVKGIIDYYFNELNSSKVTADVNIENIGSVKILKKFMQPVREFFSETDDCTYRRYEIKKDGFKKLFEFGF